MFFEVMFGCIMSKIFVFIIVLVNVMVKDKFFTQPDGIGITFSKKGFVYR